MTTPTTQLPNKLSALLRLAVQDAQKCEAMPETYQLDMHQWHEPYDDVCFVCMSGSIMAQTLMVSPENSLDYNDWDDDTSKKLAAVNDMRVGLLRYAAARLELPADDGAFHAAEATIISGFDEEKGRASWPDYDRAVSILEAAGS